MHRFNEYLNKVTFTLAFFLLYVQYSNKKKYLTFQKSGLVFFAEAKSCLKVEKSVKSLLLASCLNKNEILQVCISTLNN
jgi:hypothetical protein